MRQMVVHTIKWQYGLGDKNKKLNSLQLTGKYLFDTTCQKLFAQYKKSSVSYFMVSMVALQELFFKRNASCKLHLDKLKSCFYSWCRINQVAFKQDLSHSQDCLLVVPTSILEDHFILLFIKAIALKALNYRPKN